MAFETVKGSLNEDAFLSHKFVFSVAGLVPLYVLECSELEKEIGTVDLPDATTVPTGIEKPGEITVTTPTHHTAEQAAWQIWMQEAADPVLPSVKKSVTIELLSLSSEVTRAWVLVGAYPYKMTVDGVKKNGSESDLHTTKYMLKYDSLTTLPV